VTYVTTGYIRKLLPSGVPVINYQESSRMTCKPGAFGVAIKRRLVCVCEREREREREREGGGGFPMD
jgi:hypothetical protein